MKDAIYIGIDLGSSRTSIATSTGTRETVWSYVGYPRDHVARKTLGGREIVFGKEAIEHRLSVDLIRPLAQGTIKGKSNNDSQQNRQAVKDLLRHVVSSAHLPKGSTLYAVIGTPAQASHESKQAILDAAEGILDSVIVCSEPFAVAYGLDFLNDTLVIDIGAGTTDLCRVHGTMPGPDDGRTHHIAGDAIDQTLGQLIRAAYPEAQFSERMVQKFKESYASVAHNMEPALVTMPVNGKPTSFDITECLRRACETIIEPTITALQELIATYDPEFQEKMRHNILLGGGGSQIRGLGRALEAGLQEYGGGKVITVEDPFYTGAQGALKISLDMPEDYWGQIASTPRRVKTAG